MRHLVVAHPSTELYGADQQMLESLRAALDDGWAVTLVLPGRGTLADRASALGALVLVADFPVLRKSLLRPARLVGLALSSVRAVHRTRRWLRTTRPDALYVSTMTLPTWLAAARLARVPVLVHVHEAEEDQSTLITAGLTAPLLLATAVVTNSEAARAAAGRVFTRIGARARVIHNGVEGPPTTPEPPGSTAGRALRLVLVGRLSPRKGSDVAVEAVGLLAADGLGTNLRLVGSTFEGYEWFERELVVRVAALGLQGAVELVGFVNPPWEEYATADIVLVPSRVEPFGNTAVEAMLALRPVIASRTQGLTEVIRDGRTGRLVIPDDAPALAAAIRALAEDPDLRARLARDGRADALAQFGTARYRQQLAAALRNLRA